MRCSDCYRLISWGSIERRSSATLKTRAAQSSSRTTRDTCAAFRRWWRTQLDVAGKIVSVVYSGDTIVERTWWGSPALARTWVRAVQSSRRNLARGVWLLLTSGFRTYRFLPVFFRNFYPRYDADSAEDRMLLDELARERFGRYNTALGIVRFTRPQVLAPDLIALPEGRLPDPHIAYSSLHETQASFAVTSWCVWRGSMKQI